MSQQFGNAFLKQKPPGIGSTFQRAVAVPARVNPPVRPGAPDRKPVFTKIFRWRLPDGETREPATVEIAGTFTDWKKIPLRRNGICDAWQVTLHDIPSHRTHHYMLLVDGQPAKDQNNDGYAVPHGPQEEQYQLMTDRGPRVFMLFAQTK